MQQIAHDTLKKIKSRGLDLAEIYLINSRTTKIDVLNQKIETSDAINETGMAIRVIKDRRLGFSFTSDLEPSQIDNCIEQAIAAAAFTADDPYNQLPLPSLLEKQGLDIYDPAIDQTPIQQKIDLALRVERAAYQTDKRIKKTEKVSYSDSESEIWIVNSLGTDVNYRSNYCGAHADVIAEDGLEMESGFGFDYKLHITDLDPNKIGREAAERATQLLGAKPIASQQLPIVLDPLVGSQVLEVLAQSLSSEAAQKGRSLFKDKTEQAVASKLISIIDNGRLTNGLSSAPFDAEGVPTRETNLIYQGTLRSFLFNTYTAAREKAGSTGNAVRASHKALPAVGHTNLYFSAGRDEILSRIKKGLYITRVMGLHTANPISGDFSFGAAGLLIENGEKTAPIRSITIAGNLIDMLKNIEAVGPDLRFFFGVGSPTLLIANLSISGT